MSAGKRVIFAFFGRGEGHKSMQAAIGGETVFSSCQNLVSSCLMTHVPNDAVIGCVIHIMQRNGQFHHAKTAGKMARVARELLDDVLSDLVADFRQSVHGEFAQVCGAIDVF